VISGGSGQGKSVTLKLILGLMRALGLARALQLKPAIMLFEEPTTGLDPVMALDIESLISKFAFGSAK